MINEAMVQQQTFARAAHDMVSRHTSPGGDTQADIAEALGIGYGQLQHLLHGRSPIPLHLAVGLHRILRDDSLTQAYAAKCGGAFLPFDTEPLGAARAQDACEKSLRFLGDCLREHGEAMAAVSEALADRVVTPEEKAESRREILDAISALGMLLQAVEAMPEHAPHAAVRAANLREAG